MRLTSLKKELLIFGILHAVLFLCVLAPLALRFYHGTGTLELYFAEQMLAGQLPYRDFASEYPPLALLSFLLPALILRTTTAFSFAFAAELLIFDLLVIFFIGDICRRLKLPVRPSLASYTLFMFATGAIAACRYDMLPAMLTIMALWAFIRSRTNLAWAALALGFAAKLYPVIIAPLFVIHHLRKRQYHKLAGGLVSFLLVTIIIALPWVFIDARGYAESFTYHFARGLHAESSYGTALLLAQVLGLARVEGALTYGSWNLSSPLADSLSKASFYILLVFLLLLYGCSALRLYRGRQNSTTTGTATDALGALLPDAALAVTIFLLTNKVFSAQYLVWLCPLLPLLTGKWRYPVGALFIVAGALTQYVYPYAYGSFELGEMLPVCLMFLRNLLLLAMAVLMVLAERPAAASSCLSISNEDAPEGQLPAHRAKW